MQRRTRQVGSPQKIKADGLLEFPIPNTVAMLLSLTILLIGGAPITISSGTAVFKQGSFLNSFFKSVTFAKGNTNIKAGPLGLFRFFEGAMTKKFSALYSSASAALNRNPTNRLTGYASPPTGTTGQFHNYKESLKIFFELMYLTDETSRLKTCPNTLGVDDYVLTLECQNLETAIKGVGNAAVIAFGSLDELKVSVELEEMVEDYKGEFAEKGLDKRKAFYQISRPLNITPEMQDEKFNNLIQQSGAVAGLWFEMRDNAAGGPTVSTGRIRNDLMITKMEVNVDDTNLIAKSTWLQLKEKMRARWGYDADEANGVGEDTGITGVAICDGNYERLLSLGEKNNLGLILSSAPQATATDYGTSQVAVLRYMADYVADVPVT